MNTDGRIFAMRLKRWFSCCVVITTLMTVVPVAMTLGTETSKIGKPMNVLFIVCDDLNNRLGCYGHDQVKTPALDKLASQGLRFDRAYCQYPVCNGSRSSFLTGLRPLTTQVFSNLTVLRSRHPDLVTLPQCFKNQGYWVAGCNKIFHGRKGNDIRAWNEYHRFVNTRNPVIEKAKREFEARHGSIGLQENLEPWNEKANSLGKLIHGQSPPGYGPTGMTDSEHMDGKIARQIIKWLENKAYGGKPFFIGAGIQKPHVAFWAPKKYFDIYNPQTFSFTINPPDDWDDISPLSLCPRYLSFDVKPGDSPKRRNITQAYYACISFIDAQIGMLLDALKHLDLWDNTIIVFTSDHGYHLGEHRMWGKATLFEEVTRVPLIVSVPGKTKPGTTSPRIVELVDLYPTLVELCGLKPPHEFDGISFAPLCTQPDRAWKNAAFTTLKRRPTGILGRAVRSKRWAYILWNDDKPSEELYDMANDPHQWKNLARNPKYVGGVREMRALLTEDRKANVLSEIKSSTHRSKTKEDLH